MDAILVAVGFETQPETVKQKLENQAARLVRSLETQEYQIDIHRLELIEALEQRNVALSELADLRSAIQKL